MALKFGDPESIQKRKEFELEAEFKLLFPESRIMELIERLDDTEIFRLDHGDSQLSHRNKEYLANIIRKWVRECLPPTEKA